MELKKKYRDPNVAVVTGGPYRQRTDNCGHPKKYRKREKQGTGPRRRRWKSRE